MERHQQSKKLSDELDEESLEFEFYNSRYFIINKKMLSLMGLWPYQNKIEKYFIRIVITTIIIISLVPQVISALVMTGNVERLIQAFGTMSYSIGIGAKFIGMVVTESKLKFLYKNIVNNWKFLETESEKHILQKSSEIGRLLTIGYIGYMLEAGLIFITLPAAHHMYDIIWPLNNQSRTAVYILEGEYLVDREEYYYYIYVFEAFIVLATVPLFSTIDSTYAVCVQQCVGLFEVVKQRLETATKQKKQKKQKKKFSSRVSWNNDAAREAITKSAELHEKVMNFGQVLESSYSMSLLFVMLCNVLVLAVASVNVLFNLTNSLQLLRFIFLIIGFTIHMFYLSWPGQKMIDGSNSIFHAAYNNQWYECSVESQLLLKFIMLRTSKPFYLTAGGFYKMNFENFEVLFKTSVSYIAVLASFKK